MNALLIATIVVAIAEIGDKTQLLSLILAARFRRPGIILLGILVATIANHALAGAVGSWITTVLSPEALRWVLGLSFIAMAGWALIPDEFDENEVPKRAAGVFVATVIAFFLAEMGDKTQVATVALAAQMNEFTMVVAGTTLGMLLANAPAVLLGNFSAEKLPLKWIRAGAAAIFLLLGLAAIFKADQWF